MTKLIIRLTMCVIASTFLAIGAQAGTVSLLFEGSFSQDDDLGHFVVTLTETTNLTLTSLGYAGGTSATGPIIPEGGFDPIVSVFNSGGTLVGFADDGRGVSSGVTGQAFDSMLTIPSLAAGDYWVFVSQYDNLYVAGDPNVAASWTYASPGFPFFTFGLPRDPVYDPNCGPSVNFCDWTATERTGNWAVDVTGLNIVPIPAAVWLFGSALGLLGWMRRPTQAVA